ncbi:hypothetical protein C8R43DRAFT_872930, partial [Mycena crocata]
IYPILTLPNEITSEISLHFLPVYPSCPPTDFLLSPTVLTHISHNWREIALATPSLWTAISLVFTDFHSDEWNNRLLLSWLARSRSLPLSIYMQVGDYMQIGELDLPLDKCIETLSLHRARWEYLELDDIMKSDAVFPLLRVPMPSLRHIDLSFVDNCGNSMNVANAPLLYSASLHSCLDLLILPWSQLTHLTVSHVLPESCAEVLQQTTSLLHCELGFSWLDDSDDDDVQPDVHLPLLQSLIFMDVSDNVPGLIETFIVPALRTLQVRESFLGTGPILALKSFITKSGCSLEELRITQPRRGIKKTVYQKAFASIPKVSFKDSA